MRRYFSIASFTALNCIFVSGSEIYNHVGGVLADQFVFAWLLMFAVTSIIALFSAYIGVTHGDVVIVFIDALIIAINISRLMYAGAYQEAEYYAKSVVLKSIDDHCAAPPDRSGVVICYRFDIYPSIRYIVAAAPPPPNAAANGGAYSSVDAITELHHRLSNKFPCRITEITHKFADTFYVSTACE